MSKLRKAARGEPCTVGLPVCIAGGENETTVLAHLPSGGISIKSHDLLGAHSCSACHDVLDGRVSHDFDPEWLEHMFLRGMKRTILKLISKELI
jgi:hypothetical protein